MAVRSALLIVLSIGSLTRLSADEVERMWVDGEVNGNPVHFVFDTGCATTVLTRQTVLKLGLQLAPHGTNSFVYVYVPEGKQDLELTEECTLKVSGRLGQIEGPTSFPVLDLPAWAKPDFEGLIGWYSVSKAIVSIDALAGSVSFLANVPAMVTNWLHIHAVSTYNGLGLEIPRGDGTNGILEVDTGFPGGVALAPDAWREWKRAHAHAPLTLGWEYSPTDGGYVHEEAWANSLSVGPIIFNNVPIEESGPSGPEHLGSQYEGTIGLTALKGFWLVYDPAHAVVYMWRRKSTYSHYSYNRLGAVFNATSEQPDKLIARVVKDSPAYAAGVRDGDLLLQVDDMNVAPWGDSSRFALPAGTKLKLLLKRNGKTFETTATLSEILKPVEASN